MSLELSRSLSMISEWEMFIKHLDLPVQLLDSDRRLLPAMLEQLCIYYLSIAACNNQS